jgi:tRNA threonylcarbamoyladenosine biosynthesis protein TsaE
VTEHLTRSERDTEAVGRALGRRLTAGAVVLLSGPLGAGKTAFTRGLAEGLGCTPGEVSSPTFTIVQEYRGRVRLQHIDLYRLSPADVDDLAIEDLWDGSVLAVEWPDRWRRRPTDAITVEIDPIDDEARRIRISG